jgi:hypothetical protein
MNLDELQALYEKWTLEIPAGDLSQADLSHQFVADYALARQIAEQWPTLRAELLEARQLLRESRNAEPNVDWFSVRERIDAWEAKWTA